MVNFSLTFSHVFRLKVHKVLVRDRQKRIRFQEELVEIIFTDKEKEMRPLDLVKQVELENVSITYFDPKNL